MGTKKVTFDMPEDLVRRVDDAINAGRANTKRDLIVAAVENFLGLPITLVSTPKKFDQKEIERIYRKDADEINPEERKLIKEEADYHRRIWLALKHYGLKQQIPAEWPPGHPGATLDFMDPNILDKLPKVE